MLLWDTGRLSISVVAIVIFDAIRRFAYDVKMTYGEKIGRYFAVDIPPSLPYIVNKEAINAPETIE